MKRRHQEVFHKDRKICMAAYDDIKDEKGVDLAAWCKIALGQVIWRLGQLDIYIRGKRSKRPNKDC